MLFELLLITLAGGLVRVNESVISSPSLVNLDPFGDGWLAEISPDDLSELSALMDSEAYKEYIR